MSYWMDDGYWLDIRSDKDQGKEQGKEQGNDQGKDQMILERGDERSWRQRLYPQSEQRERS